MSPVIRVGQTKALERRELRFDEVEPACVCGRRDQNHLVAMGICLERGVPVRTEVVHDQVDAFLLRIAPAKALPGLKDVAGRFSSVDDTLEDITMNIIET